MSTDSKLQGPDFLVIGAQRSGTSWLHFVLRQHSQCWLPPVKELHYFDKPRINRGCLSLKEWRRTWMAAASLDPWLLRYWFGSRSDGWYAGLFEKARHKGRIVGEITPAYAVLGEDAFRRIRRLNPNVKLVFVMRDPVERAWSAANNAFNKSRVDGDRTEATLLTRVLSSRGTALRSSYTVTISRLEQVFPTEQVHYCFFDDLRERPASFIDAILTFLGADPSELSRIKLSGPRNIAVPTRAIPTEFEYRVAQDYLPMIRELCDRFDGPPRLWRARYEAVLAERS
jgi:hypothetical protein